MKPSRVDFFDPLYEFVTFEEAARRRGRGLMDIAFARREVNFYGESISPLREDKVILPFLSSIEFTRQSFLRQSNLAFLVYPSATHTRFAHAIGACYLGFLASQRIGVGEIVGDKKITHPVYLAGFLQETGWREEFYLALLLHDIGHFPFSHTLENNKDFWLAFKEEIHHEEAACQLIQGQGAIYEASRRRVKEISNKRKEEHPHLAKLFERFPEIDRDAICYLISGDEKYLANKPNKKCVELRVVHELVSGLLDLDRVDHYRRDNYFTGLRSGTSLNFPSLLGGMTFYYEPNNSNRGPQLHLSPSAIGQAISLLQNKERLSEDCFEHPDNIAYEVMLHQVFNLNIYGEQFYESHEYEVEGGNEEVYDLLVSTDEALLAALSKGDSKLIKDIIFRIMNRNPYYAVAKLKFPPGHNCSLQSIRQEMASAVGIRKKDVVLRVLKRFGTDRQKTRSSEWLDLEKLRDNEGKRLVDGKYQRQIEHFQQAQEDTSDLLWLYTPEKKNIEKFRKSLEQVRKKFGCEEEGL